MIFNPSPSFVLFGILLLVNNSHGAIFSTHNHGTRMLSQPRVVPLLQSSGMMDEADSILNKFRQYLRSRKRRHLGDDTIDPHMSNSLRATWMDLGNETTHNQALIHWCGNNSKVIFILTRRKDSPSGHISASQLYRSKNYGETFSPVDADKNFDSHTILKEYVVSPSNKRKVVFMDTYPKSRRIWVSDDEGETYKAHEIPFAMDKIEFHPDQADWLLGYDKTAQTLHVSMDLGSTWSMLSNMVTKDRFYWYVRDVDMGKDANKIVFFEYRDMRTFPAKSYLLKSCYIPDCIPTSFQKMCDDLQRIDAESLVVQNDFVFVQKTGLLQKFYVSYKRGKFQKAEFPLDGEQINFHVVSSDWSTVVVGVNHDRGPTNLYFSDPEGKQFSLSLPNVRNFESKIGDNMAFNVDIHKVAGVRGAFLVNKMGSLMLRTRNYTYLTWDNGKSWRRLLASNKAGSSFCEKLTSGDCHLNLHCSMVQTHSGYYMPGMLSKESVPGLIIAHGSVGITLSDRPSVVSVFVSRDAGASWNHALDGRHLFVMGDHGAMLVAAKMIFKEPITSIQFSKDLGQSWTEHNFTNTSVHPDGLLTEPGEYTHHFTLFTHENYISNWKIFAIDMSTLLPRNCSYPGDFANWTMPPKENRAKCHMGRKDWVMRVNAHDCLVGTDHKLQMNHQVCNCTDEDYECGYGYVTLPGDKCISTEPVIDWVDDVPHIVAEEASKEDCINGQRKVPTNWRRVPGDQCKIDLPLKLFSFERCNDTPTEPVVLQLLNSSTSAKVGQGLLITVQGPPNVQWVVTRRSEPPVNVTIKHPKNKNHTVALTVKYPGDYQVKAFYKDKPDIYDDLVVSFWYPIEEVAVVLPPSVAVNSLYNVTALVVSKSGIPVTHSHFGNIDYTWDGDIQNTVSSSHSITMKHPHVGSYYLRVQARNSVSYKKGSGRVEVKPYVVTLFLPLVFTQKIDQTKLTLDWLKDMENLILAKLMRILGFSQLLVTQQFTLGHNWHIFIEPSLPLQVQLIFLPNEHGLPINSILREIVVNFMQLIQESPITVTLSNSNGVATGEPYIISGNQRYSGSSTASTAVIVVCVLLSIFLVVGIMLFGRRYARNSRWGRYFTMPTANNMNLPPIIRGRSHDRAPIVEDEEFFDDELDNMEDLASSTANGGTLQFRG